MGTTRKKEKDQSATVCWFMMMSCCLLIKPAKAQEEVGVVSLGLTWSDLVSFGLLAFTWSYLISLALTRIHLVSLVAFTRSLLLSLGSKKRKRENLIKAKGKSEYAGTPSFHPALTILRHHADACTIRNETISQLGSKTPSSDVHVSMFKQLPEQVH